MSPDTVATDSKNASDGYRILGYRILLRAMEDCANNGMLMHPGAKDANGEMHTREEVIAEAEDWILHSDQCSLICTVVGKPYNKMTGEEILGLARDPNINWFQVSLIASRLMS